MLVVVDLQPDFMPGGALPVGEGDELVAPIRELVRSGRFGLHVATQDWHPEGHVSFASSHEGQ
ncbi:MAG: nicotinamidase, partial [Gemmatimonadetes bacterium]|nr:nicotinamidase [Gemmatimonadota bacterium]NIQ52624.1 nicotinamidase [Gemmatimonadota bacterium]NIU76540.1 nicotinamidase [Gammaproteobacteria bacterium]NIX43162.1 nicotinamidase [Gemmatimonadota bacterium]NIY07328.1 nicotinamidase [Gemmatimonadota bacterium]